MRIHTCGEERAPVVIMLPGSFCNADTMMNIIMGLEAEFHILAVDYNGQYTKAWIIPGTEDLRPYITASDKKKKWIMGTVGMAVIAAGLSGTMCMILR